ncbi:MAG: ubiquitin-like small modifier protein 1 [Halobacteriales archaeon]
MEWKLFADLAEVAGERHVAVDEEATTAGEALEALLDAHPALADRVLEESGDLADHVNLLLNGENVAGAEGLETPVSPDDELALFPPVSGG